eukprot:2972892-Amphidinium_carterae.1
MFWKHCPDDIVILRHNLLEMGCYDSCLGCANSLTMLPVLQELVQATSPSLPSSARPPRSAANSGGAGGKSISYLQRQGCKYGPASQIFKPAFR